MTPLDDPRAFADVLRDWMARNGLTNYAVAKLFGVANQVSVQFWLEGKSATYEPALRAMMTLKDEGRV